MDKLNYFYKKYFVLRFSLLFSIFQLIDVLWLNKHWGAEFNLFTCFIINTLFFYCMIKLFSQFKVSYFIVTFLLTVMTTVTIYFQLSGNYRISPKIAIAIMMATKTEMSMFLDIKFVFAILLSFLLWFAFLYPEIKDRKKNYFSKIQILPSIIFFYISVIHPYYYKKLLFEYLNILEHRYITSYPNLIIDSFLDGYSVNKNFSQEKKDLSPFLHKVKNQNIITLFYLGESLRADHLINYFPSHRHISSLIDSDPNILSFGYIQSSDTLTYQSTAAMITSKTQHNTVAERYSENPIVYLFNSFHIPTYYVGEITETDDLIMDYLSKGFKNKISTTFNLSKLKLSKVYELNNGTKTVLDKIKHNKNTKNAFIMMRNLGNHEPFNMDYPIEYKKFQPTCDTTKWKNCTQQELINTYDNAAYYTDFLIHDIVQQLKTLSTPALFIYSSDHGKSLGEEGFYMSGPNKVQNRTVALLVFVNNAYKKAYPNKYQALMQNAKKYKNQLTHNVIWHSLLDGSGFINKKAQDPIKKEFSIFSSKLKPELKTNWYYTKYKKY